jgi:enolase-phosphatase E1
VIRAILTDIEGTTTSLSFVQQVLFPYAAARLPDFVRLHRNDPAVASLLEDARACVEGPSDDETLIARMLEWIASDRKITPLKAIQGLIWEEGYALGDLRGHLYPDAARWLRQWHDAGIHLYVYSSGSVHAQRLLFGHTDDGDLTGLFSGFFDTRIGGKRESASYAAIAQTIRSTHADVTPGGILFLSDILEELDAARKAGLATLALQRDRPGDPMGTHVVVSDFDGIALERLAAH